MTSWISATVVTVLAIATLAGQVHAAGFETPVERTYKYTPPAPERQSPAM